MGKLNHIGRKIGKTFTALTAKRAPTEAELFFTKHNIQFRISRGVVVTGPIDLTFMKLAQLPDLTQVVVDGSFFCNDNNLTSLRGAPERVRGGFFCGKNLLTSLTGAPRRVEGVFNCDVNSLRTLEGAPDIVTKEFRCLGNPLISLIGLPKTCGQIHSPFGLFATRDDVPEKIRLTKAEQAEAREALATRSTVLDSALRVGRPLTLKRGTP